MFLERTRRTDKEHSTQTRQCDSQTRPDINKPRTHTYWNSYKDQ